MKDINEGLYKLISANAPPGRDPLTLYYGLAQEWPQLNSKTRLSMVNAPEIHIAANSLWEPMKIWQDKRGVRARVWRALGELLNKQSWKRRGQFYDISPVSSGISTETLRLKRYGYSTAMGDSMSIMCAYHPASDTLYIRDERPLSHQVAC